MANGSIHKIARAVHSGPSIFRQYERETRLGFLNRHLPTRDSLGGKRLGALRYYDPQFKKETGLLLRCPDPPFA